MAADPWLLDVPAQEAYHEGTLIEPTVRHWDFYGFDITYNSTTGRIEIRGGGGLDWQESVRLATIVALPANTRTGNVLLADGVGALSVDGAAAAVGDRILVKDEGLGANNGIYIVDVAGDGATRWQMTRSPLTDETGELTNGLMVYVSSDSTTIGNQVWMCSTADPIVVNTTPTVWVLAFAVGANVAGPASSTDNAIARWDGATGTLLQDSAVLVTDAGSINFGAAVVTPGITQAQHVGAGAADTLNIYAQDTDLAGGDAGGWLILRPGHGTTEGQFKIQDGSSTDRLAMSAAGDFTLTPPASFLVQTGGAYRAEITTTELRLDGDITIVPSTVTPVLSQDTHAGAGVADTFLIHAQDTNLAGGDTGGDLHLRPGVGTTAGELELQDAGGTPRFKIDASGVVTTDSAGSSTFNASTLVSLDTLGTNRLIARTTSIEFRPALVQWLTSTASPILTQADHTGAGVADVMTIHAQDTNFAGGDTGGALDIRAGTGTTWGTLSLQDPGGTDRFQIDSSGNLILSPITDITSSSAQGRAPVVNEQFDGVQTTDATITTAASYTVSATEAVTFTVEVAMRSATDGDSGGTIIRGVAENTGGALAIIGANVADVAQAEDGTWGTVQGAPVIVDASGADLRVRVEGGAADTVNWSVYMRVVRHQAT